MAGEGWKIMHTHIPKFALGPSGCGPSGGLLLVGPHGSASDKYRAVLAFHFSNEQCPQTTLGELGHFSDKFPPSRQFQGYSAYICGAKVSDVKKPIDSSPQMLLLEDMIDSCVSRGIPRSKIKYIACEEVYSDSSGQLYISRMASKRNWDHMKP